MEPKVYVTNNVGNTVSVIDTTTDKVTTTVDVGSNPFGVAIAPDGTKVYVTNAYSGTISVIDATADKVIATVPAGTFTWGAAVTPDGSKVYVANVISGTVSVIDTTTNGIIATVNVGSNPVAFGQFICTAPTTNTAPIANEGEDKTANEGNAVSFSGSYTDAESADTHTFLWDFGDGTTTSNTLTPAHVYAENGVYTATLTVTDDDGGVGTDTLTVTVNNANPVVEVGSDKTIINEGDTVSFSGSYSDAGSDDTHIIGWDFGDDTTASGTLNPTHVYADNGVYTATLTVTDDDGGVGTDTLTITVNNINPTLGKIVSPIDPVSLNTKVTTNCTFTDAGLEDTHTGIWHWGDGTSSAGIVTEAKGAGKIIGEHPYTEAGVYWVTLTVTDKDGGSSSVTTEGYVVIYNPEGGFVTGGGWINSHAGAYVADDTLEGKATFGFVSKYEKGATVPTGKTEFQFKVADLNFKSTSYDWLVVSGPKAKYKGTGTINGEENYGFMLSAVDGAIKGDGIDKFRIKIWDKDTEETIYDNEIGSGVKIEEDVEPSTAISGGSIVVHKEK